MTAYRCKEAAENLPLALWTDRPAQLSNKSKFQNLSWRMLPGRSISARARGRRFGRLLLRVWD